MVDAMSLECRRNKGKVGVLLAQLGTPDAPTASALRRYLAEFLWDRRVIEVPRVLWWCILHGIILRTRPKKSAALYARIWTDTGSPLLKTTASCRDKLERTLRADNPDIEVCFGMRYGRPSLQSALDQLIDKGCDRILLFPMYPQYAAATTASTYDAVFSHLLTKRSVPTLRVVAPYFNDPAYLQPLSECISAVLQERPDVEKVIISYHGVPEEYVEKGDPYCCMCTETTEELRASIKLPPDKIVQTFQSRFGSKPWLRPYTDITLSQMAKEGIGTIAVACPGFTADCLETIDEIGHEGRKLFIESGGKDLVLVPCLNDRDSWIAGMARIVRRELSGWLEDREKPRELTCPWRHQRHQECC